MGEKSFAAQMRVMIEGIKSNGTAAIYCDNLINYLKEVENSPELESTPADLERYKADLQNWVEQNKHQHDSKLELFRAVITAGQNAIKSSFLLNGGAAVALLAFIGHLASVNQEKVATFGNCLLPFTYGVLAVAVTSGLTYLCQWFYASNNQLVTKWDVGFKFNILCIFTGFSSYGFFVWGLYLSYKALSSYV
jgi:hypothetical protein